MAFGGGRAPRKPFCAALERDISTPASVRDWDIEHTSTMWDERPFRTISEVARAHEVAQTAWARLGRTVHSDYAEVDWGLWDDDGRDSRDHLQVHRCGGAPLSFDEAVRLDRHLLRGERATDKHYTGLRPQDRAAYELERSALRQTSAQRHVP